MLLIGTLNIPGISIDPVIDNTPLSKPVKMFSKFSPLRIGSMIVMG